MMHLAGRLFAIHHDADGALTGAKRHHHAVRGPYRHETGRRDELDREDKQPQRGQKAARKF
ncbi:hypothetical protein TomMM35A_00220 [Sphingobium sp. TomMM35A]